jgi:hypothetical protein
MVGYPQRDVFAARVADREAEQVQRAASSSPLKK